MEELVAVVVAALVAADCDAAAALPAEDQPQLTGAKAAVGITRVKRGRTEYLGISTDETEAREVYGQSVEAELFADVYAPASLGGTACTAAASDVCETLLSGVSGLTVSDVTLGRCEFDSESNYFRCTVAMTAKGYLYAVTDEDSTVFESFTLKGNLEA